MKKTRLFVLCMLASLVISCEESTTNMHYTFFTADELSEIYINKDSALSLQVDVSKRKTYDEFVSSKKEYFEEDTICFISESGDTIRFSTYNSISIYNNPSFFTRTVADSKAYSSMVAIDSCSMYSISFSLSTENINNSKIINKDLYYSRVEYDYKKSLSYRIDPKDSSKINNQGIKYSYEPIIIMKESLNNCFTIRQFDTSSNEILKIVYSNMYGFLMIKDNNHLLTRIDI